MVMSPQDLHFDRRQFRELFNREMEEPFGIQLKWLMRRNLVEQKFDSYALTRSGRAWATTIATQFYSWPAIRKIMKSAIHRRLIPMTHEEAFQMPIYALFHPEHVLRQCDDLSLVLDYVKALRDANPKWLETLVAAVLRTIPRYGLPEWRSYISLAGRRLGRSRSSTYSKASAISKRRWHRDVDFAWGEQETGRIEPEWPTGVSGTPKPDRDAKVVTSLPLDDSSKDLERRRAVDIEGIV